MSLRRPRGAVLLMYVLYVGRPEQSSVFILFIYFTIIIIINYLFFIVYINTFFFVNSLHGYFVSRFDIVVFCYLVCSSRVSARTRRAN